MRKYFGCFRFGAGHRHHAGRIEMPGAEETTDDQQVLDGNGPDQFTLIEGRGVVDLHPHVARRMRPLEGVDDRILGLQEFLGAWSVG